MSKAPLYPFQANAIERIEAGDPTYLGFDPGLGKSRTALEAARKRKAKRILVVAPASGRYVWKTECAKWWPNLPFTMIKSSSDVRGLKNSGVVMITYGLLSKVSGPYAKAIADGEAFDFTILDEAAYLKNPKANRTKAVFRKSVLQKLGYVLPMSGTPAPNHAGELYPVLLSLYPAAIDTGHGYLMNQMAFEDRFCRIAMKPFGYGGRKVRVIEGSQNLPELRKRISPFMLRVRKHEVLKDLPPIRFDTVAIEPDTSVIITISEAALADLDDDELLEYLEGRQGTHVMRLRHELGAAKVPAAIEYISEFLENSDEDQKVLVFGVHKDVIEALMRGLADFNPVCVVGATTPKERDEAVDAFLTNPRVRLLIGNVQAAGTGLTLIGPACKCSDVFFVEATYSVGDNVQAACRIHRIGQHDGVVARFLMSYGTLDVRIMEILARKARDFEMLFD